MTDGRRTATTGALVHRMVRAEPRLRFRLGEVAKWSAEWSRERGWKAYVVKAASRVQYPAPSDRSRWGRNGSTTPIAGERDERSQPPRALSPAP